MSTAQPVVVYPNSMLAEPSSHSKGSFGPVFIALSVIIVLAMLACCLGRLCSRRFSHPKAKHGRAAHGKGDLEDGFEISMPTARRGGNGEIRDAKPAENGGIKEVRGGNGHIREAKIAENGGMKGEVKPVKNGEGRSSA
ncbi:uncharacterized protein LOC131234692 [Magnolia sinica]|uniref:uncharacterized protein LOC131234692 n=1 Tax=Magnolia sinica TaxID=86752 RepID=UPI002657DD99|nr:uncharacterized protein LOC131234692 [Magnolia sinica]